MGLLDFFGRKPDYDALAAQANRCAEADDLVTAEKLWRRLHRHYPARAEPHNMIGAMIIQSGDFETALDWFIRADEIEPDAVYSLNAGIALKELGKAEESRPQFEKAILLDPESVPARYNLALVCERLGDLDAAREQWRWMQRLLPGTHVSAEFFADIRRKCAELDTAIGDGGAAPGVPMNKDSVAARHNTIRSLQDEGALRAILDGEQALDERIVAAQCLSSLQSDAAGFVTWDERMPLLASIVSQYSDRPVTFDRDAVAKALENVEGFEVQYLVPLHPQREFAEALLEHFRGFSETTGRLVRAAFGDDVAAEAAFAEYLLPHASDSYAETFCDTFEDRVALANRVARDWIPHPEYTWKTREDAIKGAFARYSLMDKPIEAQIGRGNDPAVDVYLRDEAELQYRIGAAIVADPPRFARTPVVTDTALGRYIKSSFEHLRARHPDTPFGASDLPEPSPEAGVQIATELASADSGEDPAAAARPAAEYCLDVLSGLELVGPSPETDGYLLTEFGRLSSMVVEGTTTSGFFVFERRGTDDEFGRHVFREIRSAVADSEALYAFYDASEVSAATLGKMLASAAHNHVGGVRGAASDSFVAAMWSDAEAAFARIDAHLFEAGVPGYQGYACLGELHDRYDYLCGTVTEWYLQPGPVFVAGELSPGTDKYGIAEPGSEMTEMTESGGHGGSWGELPRLGQRLVDKLAGTLPAADGMRVTGRSSR